MLHTTHTDRQSLTVCYFGSYDPNYIRVRVIVKGLRSNNVKVIECHSRHRNRLVRLAILARKFLACRNAVDVILVSEAGQAYAPLAKLLGLTTGKPVVLDAFLSHYQVAVVDAAKVPAGSPRAKFLHFLDAAACRLADKVLLDTEEHVDYFCQEFGLRRTKFSSVPVGADDEWFHEQPLEDTNTNNAFNLLYVGTFYPLQGVEYVVQAAQLLRDDRAIRFDFYGDGPMRGYVDELARKANLAGVTFHGWIPPEAVPAAMAKSHVCLGHFGLTRQSRMVIPGKVYQALAMGKPVITGDTPAIRRYLTHKEHAYLCSPGNAAAIAEAIRELRNNPSLRQKLGKNGLTHFRQTASPEKVGARVKAICEALLATRTRRTSALES